MVDGEMRVLPLFVSALALLVAIVHVAVSRGGSQKRELASLQDRVESMAAEIEDLRSAMRTNEAALRRQAELARSSVSVPAQAPAQPSAPLAAPEAAPGRAVPPAMAEAQAKARQTLFDRTRPASERVDALLALRKSINGRTEEVARVALELAQDQAVSPRLRAEALRHLSRLEYPSMKEPLLGILTRERDSGTRTEAVELLQRFLGDPTVRSVVQGAQNDPDRRVSEEARQRLADWESNARR
jgi:HEAT repeats